MAMNRNKCTHDFLDHESDILNKLCADCVSACADSFTRNSIVSDVLTNMRIPVHLVSSKNDSKVIIILKTEQIRLVVAEKICQT